MAPESTHKTPLPGLSLYADLLDARGARASAPGTISRAPVVFKHPDGGADKHDGDLSAQRQEPSAGTYKIPFVLQNNCCG